ncbi:MAG: response regulator [Deltaproteobacteria bacterium]|jgi:signal transduction histidine kinase/DNA-binding response OmpR family regulator|nr:response regulator [Deltaproteobacteria bacterium]
MEQFDNTASVNNQAASADAICELLFEYLRDVIYNPTKAKLDPDALSGKFRDLGLGLMFIADCLSETRDFANALAKGDLKAKMPGAGNEIAAPLKTLYSALKHLTWQANEIAAGDYSQRVDFMGEFADAFNDMILQLDERNRELVMSKLTAEATSKAKSSFLTKVSQEMRTPLNAILGLSAVELQKDLPTLTRLNLEKIWNAGSSLLRIVSDILDISRAESGNFEIIPVDYSLMELAKDLVQVNIVRIGTKDISFELEMDPTIPQRLSGDSLRVKQILNNVLSNAFKYTDRGKVRFAISWEREGDNAQIRFQVSDSGRGINPEDLQTLFTNNQEINSDANRYVEGTGLGLSITKYLVDLMGGSIIAESVYGQGSTFTVTLPQKIIAEEPIGERAATDFESFRSIDKGLSVEGNLARTPMPYGRVLLVDDVPTNLDVAEGLLSPYGLKVTIATSGIEAIEKISAIKDKDPSHLKYDIIFMDHMMPGMDGVEATRLIRSNIKTDYAKHVPIIAFTANAIPGTAKYFLESGFTGYLPKPIDIVQLDAVLNKWVRKKERESVPAVKVVEDQPSSSDRPLLGIKIEGLDVETGIRRYGKEDKYIKILKSYVLHTPKLLETIKATARSSFKDYAVAVHGLKGSSYGISANLVGDMAASLEHMAKEGKSDNFADTHLSLLEMTKKLIEDLNKFLSSYDQNKSKSVVKDMRKSPDKDLLQMLLEVSKRGKTSRMEDILSQLELFDYERDSDLVPYLREQMENFDYPQICDKLCQYLGQTHPRFT